MATEKLKQSRQQSLKTAMSTDVKVVLIIFIYQ